MYFSSASLRIGDRRRVFCAAVKPAAIARSAGFVAARANSKLQCQPFNFQHYSQFRYTGGTARESQAPVPKPAPARHPPPEAFHRCSPRSGCAVRANGQELDERRPSPTARPTRRGKKIMRLGRDIRFQGTSGRSRVARRTPEIDPLGDIPHRSQGLTEARLTLTVFENLN